ncbi:molybdate ABC transporter permease subunit [Euzebya sp.]|uniref:molybdate ABC transporter permease subunit n=1 Tax=Euzebya sp. TaxID=1971409 RepID=UPI0035130D33
MSGRGVPGAHRVLTGLAVAGLALVVVPLVGLVGRAPLARVPALVTSAAVLDAIRLSLVTSGAALVVSTVLGVPLAWLFARTRVRGLSLLRAVAVLPMVLPPVVGGVALLLAFGRRGLLGGPLEALTGVRLPFTTAGAVLAATFVAMPVLVVTVEAGLRQADQRLEDAAATLGASRWTIYRRITLPQIGPSLAAGMALCWARALGEFGATITFAGNFPGRTQTMPLGVYLLLESDPEAAYVLSLLLLAISVAVLVVLRGRYLGTSAS